MQIAKLNVNMLTGCTLHSTSVFTNSKETSREWNIAHTELQHTLNTSARQFYTFITVYIIEIINTFSWFGITKDIIVS